MRALLTLLLLTAATAHALPDLRLDVDILAGDVRTEVKSFATGACELQPADLCVGGPGARKLLRFGVLATNVGDEDLVMGTPNATDVLPNGDPTWVFSACPSHNHWHFQAFARYELRARGGTEAVMTGQKRSFCIEDTKPEESLGAGPTRRYCCRGTDACEMPGIQGIQVGWGDLYGSTLDCQWIDVTEVPPGDYDLVVILNPGGVLCGVGGICESNPDNNIGIVPVTLAGPSATEPAPRVKVKGGRKTRRAGRTVKVAWQTHMKGGQKALRVQDVFYSLDGGATFELIETGLGGKVRKVSWTVPAGTTSEQAVIKVVAWSQAGQRGVGMGKPFRIEP
ncbi:MAG TPA: lysyl oxidase family protein [Candidatus Binatia bacterium]|jgi:hypothetical protein|nr:lysyl oxidase family protein [Candidatus Binatia bacterium]